MSSSRIGTTLMECSLVMFKSDGTRKDIPLVGARSVIGRMSTCEIRIPLNSVSREHCELLHDGVSLRYRDLNSSNGVVHNGAKSKQGTLKAGDELVIGPVVFTVMIDGKPAKITPIRTILDEAEDRRAVAEVPFKPDAGGSKAATMVMADAPKLASSPAPKLAGKSGIAPVPIPLPPMPSREIGSSGEQVEALRADSNFEEFNTPARKPAVPAMPAPIGDDDDVKPAELVESEGEGFEFVDEEHGDEEAPAFTFE